MDGVLFEIETWDTELRFPTFYEQSCYYHLKDELSLENYELFLSVCFIKLVIYCEKLLEWIFSLNFTAIS